MEALPGDAIEDHLPREAFSDQRRLARSRVFFLFVVFTASLLIGMVILIVSMFFMKAPVAERRRLLNNESHDVVIVNRAYQLN
ncbi:hypothetical protein IscW_ISCW010606 [Ixodes scapularis]|uniref:Uncharacterized protein n=1 Tax=Ixodes scapularis TaxID=6945 RepID=B7Q9B4_IXOSC|nr:hypothetical protein IscW_ISCW010606 [Ixodes scapularis]|eukprot:XP_002405696.1 hypothetical protein IscW_ISCW010606 [Ixodes scapularis]